MTNINSVMKSAKKVLFTDSEHFHVDVTGLTLSEIKDRFSIIGNIRKLCISGSDYVYGFGLSGISYNFTLKMV